MSDVERHYHVDHRQEVRERPVLRGIGTRYDAGVVLLPDLAGEGPDKLMTPGAEIVLGRGVTELHEEVIILSPLEFELEGLTFLCRCCCCFS